MTPSVSERAKGELVATGAAAALYAAATLWLCRPLGARMATGLSASADVLLNYWAMAWTYHILPRDPLSLFDANIFFPRERTLAYSEHLFGVSLVGAPAYLLSGSVVLAYNVAFAASFVLSGVGAYLLVRELTGSRAAGLVAGLLYLAAPFRFLHVLHIQLLAMEWFPFVFLFLFRYLRDGRPRQAVGFGAATLLQVLSCNYYAMYLALALALFFAVAAAARWAGARLAPRRLGGALAALGLVAALALPFVLPYEQNRREGFYRRYEDVVQFSARPSDYLRPTAFNAAPHWRWLPRQERSEKALFPGMLAIALAAAGLLVAARRQRAVPRPAAPDAALARVFWVFFAVLLLVAFVLSLGPEIAVGETRVPLPYRSLYRSVPGFRGMRAPARLAVLVVLAVSVLAGRGAAALLRRRGRAAGAGIAAALVGLALFDLQTYRLDRIFPPAPAVPAVYAWLAAQPGDDGLLEVPIHEDITREAIRLYYATVHWKRLANGFSGWWPNEYWVLVGRMRYFPTATLLRYLEREVPVRYILVHYGELDPPRRRRLRAAMERYRDRLPARARFGDDVVYERLAAPAADTR